MKNNHKIFYFLIGIISLLFAISTYAQQVVIPPIPENSSDIQIPNIPSNTFMTPEPFGSNLFQGGFFVGDREDGINSEYIIQPGDRITLQIWGALEMNETVIVDTQGNIFVPGVGPIKLAGTRNENLNNHIASAVSQVFTRNVNVYTNLQGTTPVIVLVTGFVNRPGSYAGTSSDSILYFLGRAGGIDLNRGSYREIRILRNNETIETIDLYDFLLNGVLARPQLTDGDTIVVEKRGASISAEGAIRNSFSFEIPKEGINGTNLIYFSRPYANATHTTILGTRNNQPVSHYIPISELESMRLLDGDQVIFEVDQVHETILVNVEGTYQGQSKFAIPRNTHLHDLLSRISVDETLGDLNSLSIRRESIKMRQAQALQDGLTRLETAILGRTAVTTEGAQIQLAEAQLIADFVQRARKVEPQGILVVAKNGIIANPLLQQGDTIHIPQYSNVIQVSGEVMVPQALVYESSYSLKDYVDRVGGYTTHADNGKHMVLRRNGEVIPVYGKSFRSFTVQPGDEIISLPAVPSKSIDVIRMVTDTMFKIASSAAIFIRF